MIIVRKDFINPVLLLCLCTLVQISKAQSLFVAATNKKLSYTGRIGFEQRDAASIYWPGSSVVVRFKGTRATAVLKDKAFNNYFLVIVDKNADSSFKIKLDTVKHAYLLAHDLSFGEHSVELFKITNVSAATSFFGFQLNGNATLLKPIRKPKRKIEFFGNSITAGHGVEVPVDSADSGKPQFFNNYLAYGAITARHFNALYHCTARSGIGIMVSWFPEIMPEIYDRLDPNDSTSKWDFKKYQPDIVVVNLFQNDSWIINQPNNEQFKARFGTTKPSEEFIINAYANFIKSLRHKYAKAKIICCMGNMDATREGSKWPRYIDAAVDLLKDKNIVIHFFQYKNTPGHPKIKEQQAMAGELINFIEKSHYWK